MNEECIICETEEEALKVMVEHPGMGAIQLSTGQWALVPATENEKDSTVSDLIPMIKPGDHVVELANEMEVIEVAGERVYCRTWNGLQRDFPLDKLVNSRPIVDDHAKHMAVYAEAQLLHTKRGGRPKGSKNKRKVIHAT